MLRTPRLLNLVLAAGAIGAGVAAYLVTGTSSSGTASAQVRTAAVLEGSVLSSVSASGNVQASQSLGLTFGQAGTLTAVWVKAGDTVRKGQRLGQIDPSDAEATVRTAKASLASAEASYASTLQGQTPEQQRQNALSVTQARTQLANARTSLADTTASLALDEAAQQRSVASARASLGAAEQTAELDAASLAAAVTSARSALAQSQATVAANRKSLEAAVAQAQKSLALARSSTGNSRTSAQTALANAQAQLATDQAKLNADIGNLDGVVGATEGAKASVAAAQAAITNGNLQLQKITEYQTANGCTAACPAPYDSLSQKQLQFRVQQDQAVLGHLNTIAATQAAIVKDQQAIATAELQLSTAGVSAEQSLANATNAYDSAVAALDKAKISDATTLANAKAQVETALRNQAAGTVKTDQSLTAARQTVQTALANQQAAMVKARQSLNQARQSVRSAELSVESALASNAVKEASAPSALAQAQAQVEQARASYRNAVEALDATVLRAPIAGTVAAVNGSVGTAVTTGGNAANTPAFVTLVDLETPQVLVGFPEADAAKLAIGQPAAVTVSALPTVQLAAHIVKVDTTATVVSNVVTYYATLQLDRRNDKVKPGMTVTATITVDKRDGVLHVPSASVQGSGGTGTVTVVDEDGVQSRVAVTTGLVGDERTEITSGLEEGQLVVSSAAVAATTATEAGGLGGRGLGGRGLGGGGGVVPRGLGG